MEDPGTRTLFISQNIISAYVHVQARGGERETGTLATPLGGYSPFSFGSTHCFTLSSLNRGVAYKKYSVDKIVSVKCKCRDEE